MKNILRKEHNCNNKPRLSNETQMCRIVRFISFMCLIFGLARFGSPLSKCHVGNIVESGSIWIHPAAQLRNITSSVLLELFLHGYSSDPLRSLPVRVLLTCVTITTRLSTLRRAGSCRIISVRGQWGSRYISAVRQEASSLKQWLTIKTTAENGDHNSEP